MNPPRRVLFVDHVNRILGGGEINLIELLQFSDFRDRFEVHAAVASQSPLECALQESGIPCHDYSLSGRANEFRVVGRRFSPWRAFQAMSAMKASQSRLREILRRLRPAAVVSCANKDHFNACKAVQDAGAASIWWVNDILSEDFFSPPVLWWFRLQANRRASRLTAVSEYARRQLERLGVHESKTAVIHNGIPLEKYPFKRSETLKQRLRLSPRSILIGHIGRFTPWKGQAFFLDLAEACAAGHPDWHFLLAGRAFNEEEDFESGLRVKAARSAFKERIHFLPFQTNMADCLAGLDVLVHSSLKPEPFGRILIESMAAGTPVVAARAGGVPEIVQSEHNGLLAQPESLESFAGALNRLLSDSRFRSDLIQNARTTVETRFHIQIVADQFSEEIEKCALEPARLFGQTPRKLPLS